MEYKATRVIEIKPSSLPLAEVVLDYSALGKGEAITLYFRLDQTQEATLLALKLSNAIAQSKTQQPIQFGIELPVHIQVGPIAYAEIKDTVDWLSHSDFISAKARTKILSASRKTHYQNPLHKEIFSEELQGAVEAFTDKVSQTINIYRGDSSYGTAISFYKNLVQNLSNPQSLMEHFSPYRSGRRRLPNGDWEGVVRDPHLSLQEVDFGLDAIALNLVKRAKTEGSYSRKRKYIGPQRNPEVQGAERKEWLAHILVNVKGITYEETKALLDGISAYSAHLYKNAGLDGHVDLSEHSALLETRKKEGAFSPSGYFYGGI